MPIAASRALAITVGVSLLILLALGGQAQAAKSTKNANAKSTLTSLVNQTKNLPKKAASKAAKAKLLRIARHARKVASKSPCTAVKDLSAYRKTLKATKISGAVQGRAARNARQAPRGARAGIDEGEPQAAVGQAHQALRRRRRRPDAKAVKTTVLSERRERHDDRRQLPALRLRREGRGGKSWTQLVLPEHRLAGRPRHARHPGLSARSRSRTARRYTVEAKSTSSYTLDGVERLPGPARPGRPGAGGALAPKPNFGAGEFSDRRSSSTRRRYKQSARPGRAGLRQVARPGARPQHRRPALPGRAVRPEDRQAQGPARTSTSTSSSTAAEDLLATRSARRGRPRRTASPAAC